MELSWRIGAALAVASLATYVFQSYASDYVGGRLPALTRMYRSRCELRRGDRVRSACLEPIVTTEAAMDLPEHRSIVTTRTIAVLAVPLEQPLAKGELMTTRHFKARRVLSAGERLVTVAVRYEDAGSGLRPGARVDLVAPGRGDGEADWRLDDLLVTEIDSDPWWEPGAAGRAPSRATLVFPSDRVDELTNERRAALQIAVRSAPRGS